MIRYSWLLFLLIPLHVSAQWNEGKLVTRNGYYEIPFEDTREPVHAAVVLKGDTYDFDLDTGGPLYISSEIQRKYKFKSISHVKATDPAGNKIDVEIVRIDTIRVGPFVFTGVAALVIDLGKSTMACSRISGNLGSNLLRHLVVQFDLQEKRIALTDNKTLLKKQLSEIPLYKRDWQNNVFFTIKADNDISDTVQFDTGDGEFYHMSQVVARRYRLLHPGNIIRKGFGVLSLGIAGPGSPFAQYVMKPGSIKVGGEVISGGLAYIPGSGTSRMGIDLLNYGLMQINYPESKYCFQRFDTSYARPQYDYGFQPVRNKEKVLVGCTWEKTDAATAGMKHGDYLLKINDIDLTLLPKCDIDAVMKKQFRQGLDSLSVTFRNKMGNIKTALLPKMPLAP